MRRANITIDDFNKELLGIERQLDALEKYSDIYKQYEGNEFSEQNQYAADLESMIVAITHEVASEIGFARDHICKFTKYIDFRIRHNSFSNEQLERIINHQLMPKEKLQLAKKFFNSDLKLILSIVDNIKSEWYQQFGNEKYSNYKKQLYNRK